MQYYTVSFETLHFMLIFAEVYVLCEKWVDKNDTN